MADNEVTLKIDGQSVTVDSTSLTDYLGHPKFEGFEVKQTLRRRGRAA